MGKTKSLNFFSQTKHACNRHIWMFPGDNPPVGLFLCTGAGPQMVEYATTGPDTRLFVSKYLLD